MNARLMILFEPEHAVTDEVMPVKSAYQRIKSAHHQNQFDKKFKSSLTCCGNMRALRPDGDVTRMRMVLDQIHQYRIPLLQAKTASLTLLLLA